MTEDIQLPENVYKRMAALRDERKRVSIFEGQESTFDAIEDQKKVLDKFDKFYSDLDEQFAGKTAHERRNARRKRERGANLKGLLVGLVVGIVGSLIATLIYNNYIAAPDAPTLEPAASSPPNSG